MTETDHLLSPGKAALALGVSIKTIDRWRELGKLEVATITEGGHRRYRRSDVEALAAERAA